MKSISTILSNLDEKGMFFRLKLDEDQLNFVKSILDPDVKIVLCDAAAGSGKTTLALACATTLVTNDPEHYTGVSYIAAPVQERQQGFLPGSLEEKSAVYFEPLYQAMETLDISMNCLISEANMMNVKNQNAYIKAMPHTYLRGTNFEKSVVIIDEAANFYTDELKKVLTRMHDTCKVIVIGHHGQVDLYKYPERSGFVRYLNWFKAMPESRICKLTHNYRGLISTFADAMPNNYDPEINLNEAESVYNKILEEQTLN